MRQPENAIGMLSRMFYFLRHGETEANARGIVSGARDVDLTPLGREQARAAARTLAAEPITTIYTSPLRRARETAEPIANELRLRVNIIPDLIERRRGEHEGQLRDALIGARTHTPPGSESFEDFAVRVLKALSQVDGHVPLIVAHQGVFRVLCQTLRIGHAEEIIANALPLRFVPEAGEWKMEELPCRPSSRP